MAGREAQVEAVEVAGWWREILVIGGKSEVGSDAAVGEDDGSSFEHVEAVGRWRGWTWLREVEGDQSRVIGWVFGARIRFRVVRVWVIRVVGFGFGFRWGFGGGGGGGGIGLPAGFAVER